MAKNANKPTKKRRVPSFLPEILLIVGISLVVVSSLHNLLRLRSLSLDKQTVETYLQSEPVRVARPTPSHIFIKWFVDVDIEPEIYQAGQWTVSPDKASYLVASAMPGEAGNLILYGHNKRSILGNIRALKGGETIVLTLTDGSTKEYKVESLRQVDPQNTTLLEPTSTEVLTIYTCAGILDSQRFVVRANPVHAV